MLELERGSESSTLLEASGVRVSSKAPEDLFALEMFSELLVPVVALFSIFSARSSIRRSFSELVAARAVRFLCNEANGSDLSA